MSVADEGELQAIRAAALLHDVGKLAVPEHILNKPGRLSPAEYDIMKRHAPIGADILAVIGFPYAVAPIVRHHHENWDGTGYPDGLAGAQIPMGSRILAVVDCFDALTSDRPYRPRMEDREALQILSDRRGKMYDPQVVDAFFVLHGKGMVSSSAPSQSQAPEVKPVTGDPLLDLAVEQHGDLDLQTFFNLGRALSAPVAPAQLGEILWTHFRAHLPATAFVLYGYDPATDSIRAVYTTGEDVSSFGSTPVALGGRLSGWVAATGQTVMNSDARLDCEGPAADECALRSALAVCLGPKGRPIGVLSFYARKSNAFDETHLRLIEAVGRALAASGSLSAPSSEYRTIKVSQTGTQALQTAHRR
jgi:putative nucleotidyltransferase with HDIG domain